jgi:hypothetical protein
MYEAKTRELELPHCVVDCGQLSGALQGAHSDSPFGSRCRISMFHASLSSRYHKLVVAHEKTEHAIAITKEPIRSVTVRSVTMTI